ncbi:grindelwald isoform X2 [Arctopsyche grandis]|uniref:grindelwald isoform X2 n=1 Tax=Arctopsyche grandis TaxID=121162 RepID=UPI00406D76E6
MAEYAMLLMAAPIVTYVEGLSLRGARCGQLTCSLQEYCSPVETRCAPCANICDSENHNYDMTLCVNDCQDYIHDLRFVRRQENDLSEDNASLKATVQKLQAHVSILTIICSVVLVLLIAFLTIKCYRYIKAHYKKMSWAWIRTKLHSPKRSSQNKIPVELAEPRRPEATGNATAAPQPLSARALQVNVNQPHRQAAEDRILGLRKICERFVVSPIIF